MCSHSNKMFVGTAKCGQEDAPMFWCYDCGAFYSWAFYETSPKVPKWTLPDDYFPVMSNVGAIVKTNSGTKSFLGPPRQYCRSGDTHGPMREYDFWASCYFPCDGVSIHSMINMFYDGETGLLYHWCKSCGSLLTWKEYTQYYQDKTTLIQLGHMMLNPRRRTMPMKALIKC